LIGPVGSDNPPHLETGLGLRRLPLRGQVRVRVLHARGGHDRLDESEGLGPLLPGDDLPAADGGSVIILWASQKDGGLKKRPRKYVMEAAAAAAPAAVRPKGRALNSTEAREGCGHAKSRGINRSGPDNAMTHCGAYS